MSKISRNAPCPCGSGKKLKKCCAAQQAAEPKSPGHGVVPEVLDWLYSRHGKAVANAMREGFFGAFEDEELSTLFSLPEQLLGLININFGEWLIADGFINAKGNLTLTREILLGSGGPRLTAEGRLWLKEITRRPLSLYEVQEVIRGEGMNVIDLLHPEEPVTFIVEKTASQSIARYDIFGARIAEWEGKPLLTGAVYPFVRDIALELLQKIRYQLDISRSPEDHRPLIATFVTCEWLKTLIEKRPLPELVDASTGDPILLVTDHYRIVDRTKLEARLNMQDDVEKTGDTEWTRFTELDRERRRSRASLTVSAPDKLRVFCRTLQLAEESLRWLQELAGDAVEYRIRETTDPRSPEAQKSAMASPPAGDTIPPEVQQRLQHEWLQRHYEQWPGEPLPALGGKTPRQAVATPTGTAKVVNLLKTFEGDEERRSRNSGLPAFDFGFLWKELGLDRKQPGGFDNSEDPEKEIHEFFMALTGEDRYPRAQLDKALTMRERLIPHLLDLIAEVPQYPEDFYDTSFHWCVAALLAHFREPAAHLPIIRAFSMPPEEVDLIWESFTTEALPALLLNTCDGKMEGIKSLVLECSACEWVRSSGLSALTFGVARGDFRRDEVVGFLATLFDRSLAEPDSEFWAGLADAICDLQIAELRDEAEKLLEEGLLNPFSLNRSDIERAFTLSPESAQQELRDELSRRVPESIHGYLAGFSGETDSTLPPIRQEKKKPGKAQAKRKAAKKARKKNRK